MGIGWIILIVVIGALIAGLIFLYFWGKRAQKRRDEQMDQMEQVAQTVSMLIIDKKKMRVTKAGLPQMVIDQLPWYAKRSKVPVVKAKIGPKIWTLIADVTIYDNIPVKKEVKATVSGIYITGVKGIRNIQKEEKKKGFFARLRNKAADKK